MFHSAFPSTKMSRHRNFRPLRGALVVVLCILLIYAYNSIFHRQYHQQNYANRNNNDHITIDNGDRQPRNIVKPAQRRVDDEFSTAATTTSTNTTVTIKTDNIIDAQRQAIASELKNFNFTEQMVGLSALTPETNGHPLQSGKLISNTSTQINEKIFIFSLNNDINSMLQQILIIIERVLTYHFE